MFDVLAMEAPSFDNPIYDDGEVHLSVFNSNDGGGEEDGDEDRSSFECYRVSEPLGGRPVRFDLAGVTPDKYTDHFRFLLLEFIRLSLFIKVILFEIQKASTPPPAW